MLALVAAILLAAAPTQSRSAPRHVLLTPAQLLAFAEDARRHGDDASAERAYEALAQDRDADLRAEAMFRHAKMLSAAGRRKDAAILLRRVLDARPGATAARLELAQLLDLMGDKEAAWREVRAAQAAGLPATVARLVDRYGEALRNARPHGATLEIAVAPDSNINRATRSDTLGTVVGDFIIDQDSKATSGIGLALRGQAYRRLALAGDDAGLLVRLSGLADLYRRSAFNDVAIDLAAGPEVRLGDSKLNLELGVSQRWFGQKGLLRSARIGATWSRPIGRRSRVRLAGSVARIDHQLNDLQDGTSYAGQAEFEHALSPTTGFTLTFCGDRQDLKDPGYATSGWRAGIMAWRDVGRATFSASAEFGRTTADARLALFPDKRSDRLSRLALGASFRQLEVGGFAPVVRVIVERNRSDIAYYDFYRRRTEVGIVRAF
ncbi:MAG: surface lipoprotein assembly modifier [Sphingomicrobium sp.]